MKNNINIIEFEEFINPISNLIDFRRKRIKFEDLKSCSYIKYVVIKHINCEIEYSDYILYNDWAFLYENYCNGDIILAINIIDDIVCEVI